MAVRNYDSYGDSVGVCSNIIVYEHFGDDFRVLYALHG